MKTQQFHVVLQRYLLKIVCYEASHAWKNLSSQWSKACVSGLNTNTHPSAH